MTDKISLGNVTSFVNDSSAALVVNNNSSAITAAIDNTLSRDGTAPNQMLSNLDMNSNRIINLPDGISTSEPATINQLSAVTTGKGNLPAGGVATQVLTKNSSATFDASWQNSTSANLTGPITSVGNTTSVASQTGTGSKFVMDTSPTIASPTLTSPTLGTPASGVATNLTGTAAGLTSGAVTGLTVATGKSLTVSNSLTFAGTDATTQTFPTTSGTVVSSVTTAGGDLSGTYPSPTVGTNAVTNAKAAQMAAFTVKGNATGSTANATDISIPALTTKASPVAGDMILLVDSAASNALKSATVGSISSAGSVASIAGNTGAFTLTGGITNTANAIKIAVGAIPGVTDGSNASSGNVGEYFSNTVLSGSSVAMTNSTATNITNISLPAGDWDLWGSFFTNNSSAAVITFMEAWISTTSATQPTRPNNGMDNLFNGSTSSNLGISAGMGRISISTTTTVYLSALVSYTGSLTGGYGFLGARRVR